MLLYDVTVYSAMIVRRDPSNDLAVLRIESAIYITFGNSEELLVGEQVAAIGNPLGEFANSITVGHISALDKLINIDGTPLNMLQTDAAINHGNSGGPLLNTNVQVIGVVTAKSARSGVDVIGFAIPSNTVSNIVSRIIEAGPLAPRPIMGVVVSTNQDIYGNTWVMVEQVNPNSGAYNAGLLVGDLIIFADDARIMLNSDLINAMDGLSPGDIFNIVVLRGDNEISLDIILDGTTTGRI